MLFLYGYTGLLALIPEQNLGIFIAYNKFEPKFHEQLVNQFIDHYYPANEKDFMRLKYADYIGNNPYGIPLPYNFLTQEEWQSLIEECQLSIVERKTYKLVVDPCKHIIFKLRV